MCVWGGGGGGKHKKITMQGHETLLMGYISGGWFGRTKPVPPLRGGYPCGNRRYGPGPPRIKPHGPRITGETAWERLRRVPSAMAEERRVPDGGFRADWAGLIFYTPAEVFSQVLFYLFCFFLLFF
jgi:hypothetical protein